MQETKMNIIKDITDKLEELLDTGDVALTFTTKEKVTIVQERIGNGRWKVHLFVNEVVPAELAEKCYNDQQNYKLFVLTENHQLTSTFKITE